MSLNVSLPPELENRVRQHVESGLYSSASAENDLLEAWLYVAKDSIEAADLRACYITHGMCQRLETGRATEKRGAKSTP